MPDSRSMLSVGIDVGTTTTQLVFSRLVLADTSRPGQVPRIGITDKSVLYQSPITFTPLADASAGLSTGRDLIDVAQLTDWVKREYAAAGVDPTQVETGAVIITGETAKKKHADEILRALSGLAGEFVVTVAGPHLESLIAGRGAGAAQYSQKYFCKVTNIDIGGGSANSALFNAGALVTAAAMNYGGRIVEIDHATGRVRHLADPARAILDDLGLRLAVGDAPALSDLRRFTDRMAGLTVELTEGTASPLAQKLYLTPPSPVSGKGTVLMLSGGIGHYFYSPLPIHSVADATLHDDVGPLLAESLRGHPVLQTYETVKPAETLRATVLGASSQTVTLSGSTIWAERETLPMKNVPVVRPAISVGADLHVDPTQGELTGSPRQIAAAIAEAVRRWDVDPATDNVAIALELDKALDYTLLLQLATGLADYARTLPAGRPLVAIIERDYAQALGQTVKAMLPDRPLLVIDQVGLQEGDYIDVGLPLMDGRVVPLSVKTLIFYH
ncbi:MAG: ethanolamine ammonia-lyase reactivating factor EutA [Chloroflexi bacterium]|nr:ethanolamine ammonia-lyase reactivating factor EutA [Chloroflexota bacterium]